MCLSHGGKQHLEQPSDSTSESATLHNLVFLTSNRNQSLHSQAADCWGCNLLISAVTPINLNIHSPTISIRICQDVWGKNAGVFVWSLSFPKNLLKTLNINRSEFVLTCPLKTITTQEPLIENMTLSQIQVELHVQNKLSSDIIVCEIHSSSQHLCITEMTYYKITEHTHIIGDDGQIKFVKMFETITSETYKIYLCILCIWRKYLRYNVLL